MTGANLAVIGPTDLDAEESYQTGDAKPWLDLLTDSETHFSRWQDASDSVDRLHGDLDQLAEGKSDREFQIFWANLEVIKPNIYAKPPVPVVTPRFKDRRDLPRRAAEMLERALISDFESDDVDGVMTLVRDDLVTCGRGVVWLSITQEPGRAPVAHAEHLDRRDFRHGVARKWPEVPWVAKQSYVGKKKALELVEQGRFSPALLQAQFGANALGADKPSGDHEVSNFGEQSTPIWEIWHKTEQAVVWVAEGVDEILDMRPPYLDLEGFFPCPPPAYSTLHRGTLVPIPDLAYYKDQIEEVNELTARISGLAEGLRVWGFIGAQPDTAAVVREALASSGTRPIISSIPSLAQFQRAGGGAGIVEWFDTTMVANTIAQLVELRKQLIDDIREITGLSDIMRGLTSASETATAQQLKSNYGSARIRGHQKELIRLARDVARMKAEIMAENFDAQTLLEMSQVDDLPSSADLAQMQAQGQQPPEDAVTIEQVMGLLRSQRLRPFVLEIETDSTIEPDRVGQQEQAVAFQQALGQTLQSSLEATVMRPEIAPVIAEVVKQTASAFQGTRSLQMAIDDLADDLSEMAKAAKAAAQQPPEPSAEEQAAQAELQLKAQAAQGDAEARQAELALKRQELALKAREVDAKVAQAMREDPPAPDHALDDLALRREELALRREEMQQKAEMHAADLDLRYRIEMAKIDAQKEAADAV